MAGSPARKEVSRVGVKVVPDTSGFGKELEAELARYANKSIDIEVKGKFAEFEADLKRITSGRHEVEIKVQADVSAAEAALARVSRDRTAKLSLDVESSAIEAAITRAQQRLSGLNSAKVTLKVDLDAAAAEAKLALLTRTETKRIKVDLDVSSFDSARDKIRDIANGLTTLFSSISGATSAISSSFGTLASTASGALNGITSASSGASAGLSSVSSMALSIAGSIAQWAGLTVLISGVIAILGSVVVAAGAAALAIGGVLIGAAALIALPVILAGVVYAFMQSSKDLKQEWDSVIGAFTEAFRSSIQPMLESFTDLASRAADAMREGQPFYDAWVLALQASAHALEPLAQGMADFATNALVGMASAMEDLMSSGFWEGIKDGLATLGEAFGTFFTSLSAWAPEFAAGFQSVADAALILLPSIANLAGAFATFAPDVITTIAESFKILFDAFSAHKDVYGAAAQAFADALASMAAPLEQVFRAFALMAPEILAAIAHGVERFAEVISDPQIIEGLTNLATTLVDLGAKAATMATELAATTGAAIEETGTYWDKLTGVLETSASVSIEHLKGLVTQADSTREAANNLQRQLAVSLNTAAREASDAMGRISLEWSRGWNAMVETGNTSGAQLNKQFASTFQQLLTDLAYNDSQITAEWRKAMESLLSEAEKSGDPLAQKMAANMRAVLAEIDKGGQANTDKVKAMLQGMENQVQASQIASILGIKMNESAAQVDTGGQKIQQSFQKVLEALPEMIRNAKTPEELATKLDQMTTIVSSKAPAMGEAFKALGNSMVKGIADADVAKATSTLMTSIQTAITAGVPAVVTAFQQLPTQLATAMATGSTGVTAAVTTQMTNITLAVTTGVTNTVTAYKKLPTDMAAASDFSATNEKIKTAMDTAKKDVETNVSAMVKELEKLTPAGKKAGELGGFANAIKSEMSQAQSAVSTGVADILSQLEQLNRTFTTNIVVNIQKNETGGADGGGGGDEPNFFRSAASDFSPLAAEPMALMAAPMSAQADLAERMTSYARAMRAPGDDGAAKTPTVQKVYNFTINAAPNVPTEEQLRKQLSYADALYE